MARPSTSASASAHGIVTFEEMLARNSILQTGLKDADRTSGTLMEEAEQKDNIEAQLRAENASLKEQLQAMTNRYWEAREQLGDADRAALVEQLAAKTAEFDELHDKHKRLGDVFRKNSEHMENMLDEERKKVMRNEVKHRLQAKSLRDLTDKYLDEVNARKELETRVADVEADGAAQVAELQKEIRRMRGHGNDLNLLYLQTKMVKEETQVQLREAQTKVARREAALAASVVQRMQRTATPRSAVRGSGKAPASPSAASDRSRASRSVMM
eukprot:c639_g1_i1.p2 GENE.c639_g1_i1~~c639_g1_i1.p2  ORF type:complete len:271 (-),score=55.41 c639_g1_i1:99-911(-)